LNPDWKAGDVVVFRVGSITRKVRFKRFIEDEAELKSILGDRYFTWYPCFEGVNIENGHHSHTWKTSVFKLLNRPLSESECLVDEGEEI